MVQVTFCKFLLMETGAQEENLFRRSNYFQHIEDPDKIDSAREWTYPMPEFGGSSNYRCKEN